MNIDIDDIGKKQRHTHTHKWIGFYGRMGWMGGMGGMDGRIWTHGRMDGWMDVFIEPSMYAHIYFLAPSGTQRRPSADTEASAFNLAAPGSMVRPPGCSRLSALTVWGFSVLGTRV